MFDGRLTCRCHRYQFNGNGKADSLGVLKAVQAPLEAQTPCFARESSYHKLIGWHQRDRKRQSSA